MPKDEQDTILHEHFPQIDTVDPNAPPANPAAPAEKSKTWNLNWGPLSWMADMSAQRLVTCFSLDLWMSFFCRSMGTPIPMLQAHAVARTMCSCKNFSLVPQGDHVLTCKKHPGANPRPQSCHGCLCTTGPQHRLLCARQSQGVDDGGRKQQAGRS